MDSRTKRGVTITAHWAGVTRVSDTTPDIPEIAAQKNRTHATGWRPPHMGPVIDLLPTKIILHCLSSESRKHLTLEMEMETEDKGVRINHCLHAVKSWSVSPLASCSDHIGTITTILLHSSSPIARGEGVKVLWGWMLYAVIVVSTCWCMASVWSSAV